MFKHRNSFQRSRCAVVICPYLCSSDATLPWGENTLPRLPYHLRSRFVTRYIVEGLGERRWLPWRFVSTYKFTNLVDKRTCWFVSVERKYMAMSFEFKCFESGSDYLRLESTFAVGARVCEALGGARTQGRDASSTQRSSTWPHADSNAIAQRRFARQTPTCWFCLTQRSLLVRMACHA